MTPTANRIRAIFEETVTCYYISIKGNYFSAVKVTASLKKVEMPNVSLVNQVHKHTLRIIHKHHRISFTTCFSIFLRKQLSSGTIFYSGAIFFSLALCYPERDVFILFVRSTRKVKNGRNARWWMMFRWCYSLKNN